MSFQRENRSSSANCVSLLSLVDYHHNYLFDSVADPVYMDMLDFLWNRAAFFPLSISNSFALFHYSIFKLKNALAHDQIDPDSLFFYPSPHDWPLLPTSLRSTYKHLCAARFINCLFCSRTDRHTHDCGFEKFSFHDFRGLPCDVLPELDTSLYCIASAYFKYCTLRAVDRAIVSHPILCFDTLVAEEYYGMPATLPPLLDDVFIFSLDESREISYPQALNFTTYVTFVGNTKQQFFLGYFDPDVDLPMNSLLFQNYYSEEIDINLAENIAVHDGMFKSIKSYPLSGCRHNCCFASSNDTFGYTIRCLLTMCFMIAFTCVVNLTANLWSACQLLFQIRCGYRNLVPLAKLIVAEQLPILFCAGDIMVSIVYGTVVVAT